MQNLSEPSGFLTNNTGDPNGELEARIKPHWSNSSNYYAISFYSYGETLYSRLAGTLAWSNNVMWCSAVTFVRLGKTFGSSAGNTSV